MQDGAGPVCDTERSQNAATKRQTPQSSAAVLDLGCGCGVPAARFLAQAGHRVTGVDISGVQIERARHLVPTGTFLCADATRLTLQPASFDAVVFLYALIHIPLADQPPLLDRIASWLRPGGWLLATAGHEAWTGTEDNWLNGPAAVWWSHADASTYWLWLQQTGLTISSQEFVPEGARGHTLFWAQRPSPNFGASLRPDLPGCRASTVPTGQRWVSSLPVGRCGSGVGRPAARPRRSRRSGCRRAGRAGV